MTDAAFVFSRFSNLNNQFMLLFKALDELKSIAPEDAAFRSHLFSLAGLLRYQFAFEEDLMLATRYRDLQLHVEEHNRLRRFLAGILDIGPAKAADMVPSHRRFREDIRRHCTTADNDLITHVNSLDRSTTVLLQNRSRAIARPI